MKNLLRKLTAIVAASAVAGFGVASATVGVSASSAQTAGEVGSALQLTRVNNYETPCYKREREARGIPMYSVHESRGYMKWYKDNWGTPEWSDWNRAAAACDSNEPVAKWDWDSMVLVSVEYI